MVETVIDTYVINMLYYISAEQSLLSTINVTKSEIQLNYKICLLYLRKYCTML